MTDLRTRRPVKRKRPAVAAVSPPPPTEPVAPAEGAESEDDRQPRSREARELLAALDAKLQRWAEDHADELDLDVDDEFDWSVEDRTVLQSIGRVVDRTVDLDAAYRRAEAPALRRELSGELRQLEKLLADLMRRVREALPASLPASKPSRTSQKAAAAANSRWEQERARNRP